MHAEYFQTRQEAEERRDDLTMFGYEVIGIREIDYSNGDISWVLYWRGIQGGNYEAELYQNKMH